MNNKTIIVVSSALLIIGIAVLFGLLTTNEQQVELSDKIDKQSIDTIKNEREWLESILDPIELHSDMEDSLFRPVILRSFGGYLYVGDYGDMKIRRFSSDGRFINEIGIGQGKGPGEFTQFMDFYVSGDTIHILDLNNLMLNQFDIEKNEFIQSFELKPYPLRIIGIADTLIIASIGGEKIFTIYDKSGGKINQFGELIEGQITSPLSVQGDLVSTESNSGFVFVPTYASYLFYFNLKGEEVKTIRTIDQRAFSAGRQRGSGDSRSVSAPETDMIAEDIAKYNGLLYIQYLKKNDDAQNEKNENNLDGFIDVYDLEKGSYKYSFDLPVPARSITIQNGILYLIRDSDNKIIAFKMKQ